MQNSAAAGARRRSVEFLPATIDEGEELPDHNNLRSSDISITLDDLDPTALNEDMPELELSTTKKVPSQSRIEIPVPNVASRATSSGNDSRQSTSRQRSSQTGVTSAIRQFARSRFSDANANVTTPRDSQSPIRNHSATTTGGVRRPRDRTATLFQRRSLGTARSSMTTSGSTLGDSQRDKGKYCLPDPAIQRLRGVINNRWWKGATLFFILALLFGPPIQDLWLPKTADVACDVIFLIAFIVLAVDILIRATVDKSYFGWDRKGNAWAPPHHKICASKYCNIHCGSFMFYFDTFALLTILYRISYTNPTMRDVYHIEVGLNENGFPKSGRHATPLTVDWALMLTVGRVGLMARFIRTSVLVQISNNFYWLRFFHPRYWWGRWSLKCDRYIDEQQNVTPVSQRVLASSSRGKPSNTDPFAVSALGESCRRASADSSSPGQLEPCVEESESVPMEDDSKHATVKRFFHKGFRRRSDESGVDSLDDNAKYQPGSILLGKGAFGRDTGSHVGAAMRELTGQRIATGALFALLVTVICNWREVDTTQVMTMLTLHGQTANLPFAELSVDVAKRSVIPSLMNYTRANTTDTIFFKEYELPDSEPLRIKEILLVSITRDGSDVYTNGYFDNKQVVSDNAKVEIVITILILFVWVLGVAAFVGPVMTLVVEPIERMVRLLSMLMKDPLGYQNTPRYQTLKREEEEIPDKSLWPEEVLKGMETNFLMNTIRRIGSLMRVGFGSAGVEIIRNNLERGRHKDVLFLSKGGSTVSCIFLFCDIRQFTDATECLQEEVFVFTNKIAAVVHSICNSYGGSANKNIGDAFLLSWLLDEKPNEAEENADDPFRESARHASSGHSDLFANSNQADKALLSVVKISMALHYDNYFVDDMAASARDRLLTKLSKRKGPVVQMGFGLHAGRAVQGAIGSQRKLDATYISESVELSEFLESSTKRYGVPLLMSDAFYDLLSPYNRYRCRKIDQLLLLNEQDEGLSDPHEILDSGEKMNLYTFDMDIDALWRGPGNDEDSTTSVSDAEQRPASAGQLQRASGSLSRRRSHLTRRASLTGFSGKEQPSPGSLKRTTQSRRSSFMPLVSRRSSGEDFKTFAAQAMAEDMAERMAEKPVSRTLVLPTGTSPYSEKAWLEPDIKTIRRDYVANGIIFPKYAEGLKSYYAKDWAQAKQCFEFVLTQRDDGPSRYFLQKMEEHGNQVPRSFIGYSVER